MNGMCIDNSVTTRRHVRIAASLICTDLCNIERDVVALETLGVDDLHVDLLDGHFSPSMPIGIDVVAHLRPRTTLPFDVHLMVTNNEFCIDSLAGIGVQRMCFHCESTRHVDHLLDRIASHGIKAGVALSPATPLSVLEFVVDRIDFVMLMLINPGFAGHAGQTMVPYARRKVAACRQMLDRSGRDIPIEVDGRIGFSSMAELVACGADILVAGTSCLFSKDAPIADNFDRMRAAIECGLAQRNEYR
jgi:ribulose-phosphate 3-epimerase